MNAKQPQSKIGILDKELNWLSKILFIMMLIIAAAIVTLNGLHGDWMMLYFRVVLLLSSIIPISLRVNLDLAKIWYSYNLNRDTLIPGTIARNSNIPEELGRIQFLITDKTGTLTRNDMVCLKILTPGGHFGVEQREELKELINKNVEDFPTGPCADYNLETGILTKR